jgi:hypothetical protein
MEIIIHIGRHKTGTTSIQNFLALNEDLLLNRYGIYYPEIGRDPLRKYHHPLFADWAANKKKLDLQLINKIIENAKRKSASRILLSSEALSQDCITETKWIQLKEAFNEEILIIVYLRRQDKYLQSMYAEEIKHGLINSKSTIKDTKTNLDYFQFLAPICRTFKKNRIIVKNFDRAIKQNLYQNFLETLGITFNDAFQLPPDNLNQSLPWRYLNIVRYANDNHFIRRLFINTISMRLIISLAKISPSFFNTPLPLTEEQRQEILSRYEESNKMVARKYLGEEDLF